MTWIRDFYGSKLINLNHIRSIEVQDFDVIAVYGDMTEADKENSEEEPLYERFVLYEGSEEEDPIVYLAALAKKLKAMD